MVKHQHRCSKGHEWGTRPIDVRRGHWCPRCAGTSPVTKADLDREAAIRGGRCLSKECRGANDKYLWQCGSEHAPWWAVYYGVHGGKWCPICARKQSKAERHIFNVIWFSHSDALHGKRGLLKTKTFQLDVYIPSLRKAVEYDGTYWHGRPNAQERDARKDRECQEAGIQLLRVKETDYVQDPTGTIVRIFEWLSGATAGVRIRPAG